MSQYVLIQGRLYICMKIIYEILSGVQVEDQGGKSKKLREAVEEKYIHLF